jgi:hypothetical protein
LAATAAEGSRYSAGDTKGVAVYEYLLFGHLFSVIVGIGNTAMNPIYGTFAKNREGPGGLAITEANYRAGRVGEFFIYAIPVFGILLVIEHPGIGFGHQFVWLSIVLYVVALGIATGILFPSVKRMIELQKELVSMGPPPEGAAPSGPPPQVAELERLGKTVGTAGGTLHVLATLLIILMVWQPGYP